MKNSRNFILKSLLVIGLISTIAGCGKTEDSKQASLPSYEDVIKNAEENGLSLESENSANNLSAKVVYQTKNNYELTCYTEISWATDDAHKCKDGDNGEDLSQLTKLTAYKSTDLNKDWGKFLKDQVLKDNSVTEYFCLTRTEIKNRQSDNQSVGLTNTNGNELVPCLRKMCATGFNFNDITNACE